MGSNEDSFENAFRDETNVRWLRSLRFFSQSYCYRDFATMKAYSEEDKTSHEQTCSEWMEERAMCVRACVRACMRVCVYIRVCSNTNFNMQSLNKK